MTEQLQAPAWPGIPKASTEYITLIAHYYRAEMGRMSGWRDRIDRTTNWAITVAGAMLSVSLSTPTAHHGVLLFAMVLVLLLLVIESRRYRFFDVYRARVRLLERQYFARVFAAGGESDAGWMRALSDDLKRPVFLMTSRAGIFPPAAPQLHLDVPDRAAWLASEDQHAQAHARRHTRTFRPLNFRMGGRSRDRSRAGLGGRCRGCSVLRLDHLHGTAPLPR